MSLNLNRKNMFICFLHFLPTRLLLVYTPATVWDYRVTWISIKWWTQGIATSDPAPSETGSPKAFHLVNIVNHSRLLSALKRGDTTADTLICESIIFLSLSCVIHLTAAARMYCHAVVSHLEVQHRLQNFVKWAKTMKLRLHTVDKKEGLFFSIRYWVMW